MTVNDLMNLDILFCEKVSKLGATSWANHFMDDGVMVVKSGDNIIGEVSIYENMKPFFDSKGSSLSWSPENGGISSDGELGYTYGQYMREYKDEKGKKVLETGRYMTIWRRQPNGNYKIEVDMGN